MAVKGCLLPAQGFSDLPRRHSWGTSDAEAGLFAESREVPQHAADTGEADPTGDNGQEDEPSTSNTSHESQEDPDAARIQHARMQVGNLWIFLPWIRL